jgi:hypothetical protein
MSEKNATRAINPKYTQSHLFNLSRNRILSKSNGRQIKEKTKMIDSSKVVIMRYAPIDARSLE